MGLYRIGIDGKATPIEALEPKDEKSLEHLLEQNPEMIFEDELIMVLGRQVNTVYGTTVDILGLDASGNVVIIELKKGLTPREVITQILEYGVWAEKELRYDELNRIAHEKGKLKDEQSLMQAYREFFQDEAEENPEFNADQRLVILAKEIDEKIEDMARYLGAREVDIYCVKYSYFKGEDDKNYFHVEKVVPKEKEEIKSVVRSEHKDFYLHFFGDLLNKLKAVRPDITTRTASSSRWCSIPVGISGVHLEWHIKGSHPNLELWLCLDMERSTKEENEKLFHYFKRLEGELRSELGQDLQFLYPWGTKWARIYKNKPFSKNNELEIDDVKNWGIEMMLKFYDSFKPRLPATL